MSRLLRTMAITVLEMKTLRLRGGEIAVRGGPYLFCSRAQRSRGRIHSGTSSHHPRMCHCCNYKSKGHLVTTSLSATSPTKGSPTPVMMGSSQPCPHAPVPGSHPQSVQFTVPGCRSSGCVPGTKPSPVIPVYSQV